MNILTTAGWKDYELIDSGEGYRLERYGDYTVARPDPQAIWKRKLSLETWQADAVFTRQNGREQWVLKKKLPEKWLLKYKSLSFYARLTPFKHTGIFPEQHLNWDFIEDAITRVQRPTKVLNLFAYTGIASIVAAQAGAQVTHVDASKPSISWAKENQEASGLNDKPIRWILDDVVKYVQREIRRGVRYDGIIMDPPVYGHGPNGERWDFAKDFPLLLESCSQILSETPLFVIVNAYAISASALMLENVMQDYLGTLQGAITTGELVLEEKENKRPLSTGIYARWQNK